MSGASMIRTKMLWRELIRSTKVRSRAIACEPGTPLDKSSRCSVCSRGAWKLCPHDQRLAAAHVAGGENAGDRGHVGFIGGDVAARVETHAELVDRAILYGTQEAHGKQHEVRVQRSA